ncbi:unnamed protein product [Alternaria alternata]
MCFGRVVKLRSAVNAYVSSHTDEVREQDLYAMSCDNKSPDEQAWMRTNGLSAHDWAVTTEYMNALKLLKIANDPLKVFVLSFNCYEVRVESYGTVNHNAHDEALEGHISTNLDAAWVKVNYYDKPDDTFILLHRYTAPPVLRDLLRASFGAVITGLDLNNFTEEIVAELEKAIWEHKLVIIKRQHDLKPKRAWELLQALDPEMIIEDDDKLMDLFHPHQWFRDSFQAIKVPDAGLFYFIGKGPQNDPRYGKPGLDMGDASVSHYYSVPLSDEDFEAGRTRFHVWYMNGMYWRHDLTKFTILRPIKFPTKGLDKQTVEWADGSGTTMEVKPGRQAFLDVEQLYDMLSDEEKRMADHSWAEYSILPFENLKDCHYAPNGLGVVTEGREQPEEELLKLGGARKEWQKKYPMVWVNPVTGKKSFMCIQHLIRRLFIRNGPDETARVIDDLGEVRKFLDNIYTRIIRPEHIWVGPEEEQDLVIFGSHGLLHSNIDYPASWGVRTIHQAFMPTKKPPVGPVPIPDVPK